MTFCTHRRSGVLTGLLWPSDTAMAGCGGDAVELVVRLIVADFQPDSVTVAPGSTTTHWLDVTADNDGLESLFGQRGVRVRLDPDHALDVGVTAVPYDEDRVDAAIDAASGSTVRAAPALEGHIEILRSPMLVLGSPGRPGRPAPQPSPPVLRSAGPAGPTSPGRDLDAVSRGEDGN